MQVVVIGNGPSRERVNLEKIPFPTIGCNALYRDFEPNLLIAADVGIQKEILESGYRGPLLLRKRVDKIEYPERPNITFFEERVKSSGLKGIEVALQEWRASRVYLIGFDFNEGGNVYAGTRNYNRSGVAGVASEWRRIVAKLGTRSKRLILVTDSPRLKDFRKNSINYSEFLKICKNHREIGAN